MASACPSQYRTLRKHYLQVLGEQKFQLLQGLPRVLTRNGSPQFARLISSFRIRLGSSIARPELCSAQVRFVPPHQLRHSPARRIDRTARIIIVEGNYLLLKHSPWNTLKPLFDVSVMVDTPEDVLRERLTARWVHHQLDEEEIRFKLDEIDLPNGRTVSDESAPADFQINN